MKLMARATVLFEGSTGEESIFKFILWASLEFYLHMAAGALQSEPYKIQSAKDESHSLLII